MEAALTAEPKSKKKSKAEVSAEPAAPVASAFALESSYGAPAGMPAFLALGIQRKLSVGAVDDPLEREADRVAELIVTNPPPSSASTAADEGSPGRNRAGGGPQLRGTNSALRVQRQPAGPATAAEATSASATLATSSPASPGLIIEDLALDVGPGQMKKSVFLAQLRDPLTSAAGEALQGTAWGVLGSVAIEPWFQNYAGQNAQQLEDAIRGETPGSAGVSQAGDYVPLVALEVGRRVREQLASAGAEAASSMGTASTVNSVLSGVAHAGANVMTDARQLASSGISLLFKAEPGAATPSTHPEAIRSRLGPGQPLDGALQTRMESGLGQSLSGVRIHNDATAVRLSESLNARAFTVGEHIAFGAGEYQPSTPVGDALIAHELAHFVQQKGSISGSMQKGEGQTDSLENDADLAAIGAVSSIWLGAKNGIAGIAQNAIPRLKSGLRLARCSSSKVKPSPAPEIAATEEEAGKYITKKMEDANSGATGPDHGIHYAHNYKRDYPDRWKEDYWKGFANPSFFDREDSMSWKLKSGVSASAGIKSWLAGLTIAECLSTVVAIQTDAVRAMIGDAKFDDHFGSAEKSVPEANLLRVKAGWSGSSIADLVEPTDASTKGDAGTLGHRPARVGERYYFYNHPKYLLKHPGGAWQGENAIYQGEFNGFQLWSGLGANDVSENQILDEMVAAYNKPRTDRDKEVLNSKYGDETKWPSEYAEGSASFPDQITADDILKAPAYTIKGETRKGGFKADSGKTLDIEKIKKL
jgi:hypothetical protein